MYIPEELRPNQKPVDDTTLSYIFNVFDELLEVKEILLRNWFIISFFNTYYISNLKIADSWNDWKSMEPL